MSRTRAGILSPKGRFREDVETDLFGLRESRVTLPVEVLLLPAQLTIPGGTGEAALVLYQGHQALEFPAGSDTICQANHYLNDYSGQGIEIDLWWSADTDTGDITWSLGWTTLNPGESSTLTYTEIPWTGTVPVISDSLTRSRIRLPVTTAIRQGQLLCLKVSRLGTTDSCAGNGHLFLVRLEYPSAS